MEAGPTSGRAVPGVGGWGMLGGAEPRWARPPPPPRPFLPVRAARRSGGSGGSGAGTRCGFAWPPEMLGVAAGMTNR